MSVTIASQPKKKKNFANSIFDTATLGSAVGHHRQTQPKVVFCCFPIPPTAEKWRLHAEDSKVGIDILTEDFTSLTTDQNLPKVNLCVESKRSQNLGSVLSCSLLKEAYGGFGRWVDERDIYESAKALDDNPSCESYLSA